MPRFTQSRAAAAAASCPAVSVLLLSLLPTAPVAVELFTASARLGQHPPKAAIGGVPPTIMNAVSVANRDAATGEPRSIMDEINDMGKNLCKEKPDAPQCKMFKEKKEEEEEEEEEEDYEETTTPPTTTSASTTTNIATTEAPSTMATTPATTSLSPTTAASTKDCRLVTNGEGGIPAGTLCVIPFTYQGEEYDGCVGTGYGGHGFCSTGSYRLEERGQWGGCAAQDQACGKTSVEARPAPPAAAAAESSAPASSVSDHNKHADGKNWRNWGDRETTTRTTTTMTTMSAKPVKVQRWGDGLRGSGTGPAAAL